MVSKALKAQTPTGRPRTGYRRSDETRSRILEAALAEATEAGFQGTSVARIAARAGVAVGVLNYHFGSKEELLRQSMVGLIKDFRSKLVFASTANSDDFFQRERAGLLIYLAYLEADSNDGAFGQKTKKAVQAFQLERALNGDGVAGQKTLRKLNKAVKAAPVGGVVVVVATGDAANDDANVDDSASADAE